MAIGDNVKAIRNEQKLTQTELANKMGISRSYLGDIENNRKNPSSKTLEMLAEKLDVSMLYLLEGKKTTQDLLKNSITMDLVNEAVENIGKKEEPQEVKDNKIPFALDINVADVNYKISGFYFTQKYSFFSDENEALFINFDFDIESDAFTDIFKNIALTILKEIGYKQDKTSDIPIIYAEPYNGDYRAKKIDYINL